MAPTRTEAATLAPSFSFYVPSANDSLIEAGAHQADAVVVHGPGGPARVDQMRRDGFEGKVLFDRADYERRAKPIVPAVWFEAQAAAGADRLLTPGRWVPFEGSSDVLRMAVVAVRADAESAPGATLLLALDSRWVTKEIYRTIEALRDVPEPIAVVLAHRSDPLSSMEAVNNILALTRNIAGLSVLRSDHGAIGAVVFGAAHGSIGLISKYRHFVPPTVEATVINNDRTPRLFVWDLMDWFTAATVAGWAMSSVKPECLLACCDGRTLDRFLDKRLASDADMHNRTVLAHLGNYVLDAPAEDRRRIFGQLCSRALDHYGPMGKMVEVTKPKPQLIQWAQFA